MIDIAAAAQADDGDRLPNPFRTRWRPASALKEIPVTVDAVLIGENPGGASAVVNGQVCSPGDSLDGLSIVSITAEAIELRAGGPRARMPVRDTPLVLRLPR